MHWKSQEMGLAEIGNSSDQATQLNLTLRLQIRRGASINSRKEGQPAFVKGPQYRNIEITIHLKAGQILLVYIINVLIEINIR